MVDIDVVDIDWPLEEEQRTLLVNSSRRSSYTRGHSRSASYGTYLPRYSLDAQYLRRLLPSDDGCCCGGVAVKTGRGLEQPFYTPRQAEEEGPRSAPAPDLNEEAGSQHNPSAASSCQARRGHRHSDSLIESEVLYSDGFFIRECEKQLLLLLDFISTRMSQVHEDMKQHKNRSLPPLKRVLTPLLDEYISNQDPEDKVDTKTEEEDDTVSIAGDSGIEDDHLTSPKGFLTRIHEVVMALKDSMETTLKQLDEMVGLYDERTQGNLGRSIMSQHNSRRFSLQDQLESSLSEINKELEEINKKEQEDVQIKMILHRAGTESFDCISILSFCLLLATIIAMSFLGAYYYKLQWVIVLRLLRSPLTIVLFLFLFGFNVMAWARTKIDYIRIFEFPINAVPTPRNVFRIASLFSVLFSLLSLSCFVMDYSYLYIVERVVSLIMWLVLLGFLISPFKIFMRSGRYALVLTMVRILIAPLPVVKFGDFWLADQFNSMVALFLDVQYVICYTGRIWNQDVKLKVCNSNDNGIRPIISCLPAFWRFWQCIRCFQKTRKIAHLINAVKYFTTFPVVIFALIFSLRVSYLDSLKHVDLDSVGWVVILWFVSSIVHALYTFVWDIVMDWGLFRFKHCTILRQTLLYPKWIYILAIIFDFFIRFACTLKLTLAIVYHIESDVIYFMLVIAEILRRWVWNFFRIEYEQILRSKTS